ncbi:MAG TPA: EMC3/TMCO1 family protein [Methanomassiliicoccales archaeon]|nr:EMC3/TMCO1 family protein [Methanomassiliicoccales archaeon]HPR97851.1 EMC3/TMCO1 family protein [Methanomassiliicoccales archaeon]
MAELPATDRKSTTSRMLLIFVFIMAIFVMFDRDLRTALGKIVGYGLEPLWGFDGSIPVVSLFITGAFMTTLSIVVRHFFTDYVKQTRSQKIMSAFNKEMSAARKENNTYKLKKMMELQPKMMEESMKQTTSQMKLMPVTMLIVIPIFAWLAVFVGNLDSAVITVPWSNFADLNKSYVLPAWVLLYSLISVPFGQLLSRGLRYYTFKKRLNVLKAEGQ